jgi:NmrA-like family
VKGAAKSLKVDLGSERDLTSAFKGQDVVVSALPAPRLASDKIWMSAAISAGVKRIIPSEFSTNLESKLSQKLPIVADKVKIRNYVENLAADGKIEWTSVNNGPFAVPFIWLSGWLGPGIVSKTATIHDSGDQIVCTSTIERIGEAVAKSLLPEHAEATRNKPIYIYSAAVSERQVTKLASKLTGIEFKEKHLSIETITREAFEAVEKGDMSKMGNFYVPFCFGDGYGGDFRDRAANEMLGLKEMTEAELEETMKGWLKQIGGNKP